MFSVTLTLAYERCKVIGLVRSKADFSRRMLGRGKYYLRLVEQRHSPISAETLSSLRHQLAEVADVSPPAVASECLAVLDLIARAESVGGFLKRR